MFESVQRALGPHQQCLDPEPHVFARACRRGEVEDIVDGTDIKRHGRILLDEAEGGIVLEVEEVFPLAGREVVDADDRMSPLPSRPGPGVIREILPLR